MVVLALGCKTTQKAIENRSAANYRNIALQRDSIYIYNVDSIIVSSNNDTVFVNNVKYRYLTEYSKDKDTVISRDTIYQSRVESVQKKKTFWDKFANISGLVMVTVVIGGIVIIVWKLLKR